MVIRINVEEQGGKRGLQLEEHEERAELGGAARGDRFLLVANHEYVNSNLMFEGVGEGREARLKATAEQVGVEMAAQGGSVLEIVPGGGHMLMFERTELVDDLITSFARRVQRRGAAVDV